MHDVGDGKRQIIAAWGYINISKVDLHVKIDSEVVKLDGVAPPDDDRQSAVFVLPPGAQINVKCKPIIAASNADSISVSLSIRYGKAEKICG